MRQECLLLLFLQADECVPLLCKLSQPQWVGGSLDSGWSGTVLEALRVSSAVCHLLSAAHQVMPINSSATSAWVTVSNSQLFQMQPWEEQDTLRMSRRKGARWQGHKE